MKSTTRSTRTHPPARHSRRAGAGSDVSARTAYLILALLIVVTALVYWNGLHGALLNFDDVEYFTNYPEVRALSWQSVGAYFSRYYVIMYQPLPVLTFALNYHVSGVAPLPLHAVNLAFHLGNIALVFVFIYQLCGRRLVALTVAALFALHPLNVEAVTWISARSSSMYTCFYLIALIFYLSYVRENSSWTRLLPVLAAFLLSLFSKAQAVTLPVVLLLIDYYRGRPLFSRRTLLEKAPFFVLSLVFGIVALSDKGTISNITQGMMVDYSFVDAVFLLGSAVVFYFVKLFVPLALSAVYVYPPKAAGHLPWMYYVAPVVLPGIALVLWRFVPRRRYALLGLGMFAATIALNIQIIPSRLFIVSERYAYFPYIGLFFVIAMWCDELAAVEARTRVRRTAFSLLVVWSATCSWLIVERNRVWRDDIVFMTDILSKNPEVPYLYRAYGNRGNGYVQRQDFRAALADYTQAIRLKPNDGQAYYSRATCYRRLGLFSESLADFNVAAEFSPNQPMVFADRAVVKYELKDYHGMMEDSSRAIELDPARHEPFNNRGVAEYLLGDYAGAERDFSASLTVNPGFADAYRNRGNLYSQRGRQAEACVDWNRAAALGSVEARQSVTASCR